MNTIEIDDLILANLLVGRIDEYTAMCKLKGECYYTSSDSVKSLKMLEFKDVYLFRFTTMEKPLLLLETEINKDEYERIMKRYKQLVRQAKIIKL